MAYLRCTGTPGGSLKLRTAQGDIASFETNLAEPLVSVKCSILATGGYDADTQTAHPINGYTEANITANGNTYTIAFGQTVYGGVLDVTRGNLHVTHGDVDLGSLDWTPYNDTFYAQLLDAYMPETSTTMPDIICEIYSPDTLSHILSKVNDNTIGLNSSQSRIHIYDSSKSSMTGVQFKTAMSGIKAVFRLATPFDIDLTPVQISALVGENNVFADTGETEVKYLYNA